jgi:hypothetical protein
VTLIMATHDVNVVSAMADVVYVLVRGGEIVAHGPPDAVFRDPALLRQSNIEPPVLSELFQRLDDLGAHLGRPATVEEAARAIVAWGGREGRALPPRAVPEAPAAAARAPTLFPEAAPGGPSSGDA